MTKERAQYVLDHRYAYNDKVVTLAEQVLGIWEDDYEPLDRRDNENF